ncbi:MAG: hypothetical protein JNM36_04145 [Chitinophagales bacterium]|nr:hypothetical protein [Chitinophagales bacterium]
MFRAYYHPEGRIANISIGSNSPVLRYEYTLRDHLGNSRVSFSDISLPAGIEYDDRLQTNTYYPYGSTIAPLSSSNQFVPNDYKYNNKEYIDDLSLNMLDYGARLLDPLTGRWNGVDALAERYHSSSGYGYVAGNPVLMVDPDGMRTWYFSESGRYLGKTDDTDADAICIVPAHNALSVAAYSNSKDIINLLGGDNKAASYLRNLGISYNVAGLEAIDKEYRGKTNGLKIKVDQTPVDHITLDNKRYVFVEWSFAMDMIKKPTNIRGSTYANAYGSGALFDVSGSIQPYTDNDFNMVTPVGGGDVNGHLHPMPSTQYFYYITKDDPTPSGFSNAPGPSDREGDMLFTRRNPYYNVVIDPINIYFYRPETTSRGRPGDNYIQIPKSIVKVNRSLIK